MLIEHSLAAAACDPHKQGHQEYLMGYGRALIYNLGMPFEKVMELQSQETGRISADGTQTFFWRLLSCAKVS